MTPASIALFTALSMASAASEPPAPTSTPPVAAEPAAAPAPAPDAAVPGTWEQVQSTTTVTTTTTGPVAVPPPTVAPTPAPAPAPRRRDPRSAALIGVGAGLLGLGAISVLFIAAPAAVVKRVSLRGADDDDSLELTSRENRYRRARIADDTMEGSFWLGASAIVIGVVVLATGVGLKARGEQPPRTARNHRRSMVRVDSGPGGLRLRF